MIICNMKKKDSLLLVFFLIISVLLLQHCTVNENNKTDVVILKVGNFEVTTNDFNEKLNELIEQNIPRQEACINLFDNYISAGIVIETAKKKGYDTTEIFNKQLDDYKRNWLYVNYNKKIDEQIIPPSYALAASFLRDEYISVDYIWIPKQYKNLSKQMFDKLKNAISVNKIMTDREFSTWNKMGLHFYVETSPLECFAPEEVLTTIFKMKLGDIDIITTQSGYHLIKLTRRAKRLGRLEDNLFALKKAVAFGNNDTIFKWYFLYKSIELNNKIVSDIDLHIDPLKDECDLNFQNPIIAEFDNIKMTETEIKNAIYRLPQSVQAFFRNKSTRKKAIATLILLNNKACNRIDSKVEDKELLCKFIKSELKINNVTDTLAFFSEMIKNDNFKHETKLKHQMQLDLKVNLSKLSNEYSFWLSPDVFVDIDKLRMNFKAVEEMKISEKKIFDDNEVVANNGNWKFTVRDFKNILGTLTPETRISISHGDNVEKAIQFLSQDLFKIKDISKLKINYQLLNAIDIVGNSYDSTKVIVNECSNIGYLCGVNLRVSELRQIFLQIPKDKQMKLLDNNTKEEVIRDLLIRKFWQNEMDSKIIEKDLNIKGDLMKFKNYLLTEMLYKQELYIEPLEVSDERLDCYLRMSIKILNKKRMEDFLFQFAKDYPIAIEEKKLKNIGVDYSKSKYSTFIKGKN